MKKKLLIIISLIVVLFTFAACGENYKFKALTDGPAALDAIKGSNNGICVQKGDYVYMINGIAPNDNDNKFNTPVKGAIYRLKMSATNEILETVVVAPKIYYNTKSVGLYIEGNKLYYTSPSTQKSKSGDTLSSYMDIFSVNLDGTKTKLISTVDSYNSACFYTIDSKVYFIYEKTFYDKDNNNEAYLATVAIRDDGKTFQCAEKYVEGVLSDDGYIYYTKNPDKTDGKITGKETYSKVYKKTLIGGTEEEILENGINISENKYAVDLEKFENGVLYYSKSEPGADSSLTIFYAYRNGEQLQLTYSTFPSPYFLGFDSSGYKGTLFYYESKLILLKAKDKMHYEITSLNSEPTFLFTEGNVLYFLMSENLYSVKILFNSQGGIDFEEKTKISTFDKVTINTEKLNLKKLDNYIYFIGKTEEEYYSDYLYRYDITKFKDKEYVPERLGVLSDADKELEEEANK